MLTGQIEAKVIARKTQATPHDIIKSPRNNCWLQLAPHPLFKRNRTAAQQYTGINNGIATELSEKKREAEEGKSSQSLESFFCSLERETSVAQAATFEEELVFKQKAMLMVRCRKGTCEGDNEAG